MDDPNASQPADLQQWFAAAQRASPIVGAVILIWSAFEITINADILRARERAATRNGQTTVSYKLPSKFRDRLNEWIKGLAVVARGAEGGAFKDEAMRLARIRNNLAHNIHAMWIDTTNELRIFTTSENKRYNQEMSAWRSDPKGKAPEMLVPTTYSGDDTRDAYNAIQACLNYALMVRAETAVAHAT